MEHHSLSSEKRIVDKNTCKIILMRLSTETPIPNEAMKMAGNFCLDQIGVSVSSFT